MALAALACGGGGDEDATSPADTEAENGTQPTQVSVSVQNFSFTPGEVTVAVGSTVTWNFESGFHTTTGTGDEEWDSGGTSDGDSFSHTFNNAGTFTFICSIHPAQMQGTVTVAP